MGINAGVFYAFSTLSTKLSILSFYLRLSPFRTFRVIVYGISLFTILYSLLQALQFTFSCRPMQKSWDLTITTGSCSGALQTCVAHSAANAAGDLALLILPTVMLWNKKMPKRDKFAVIGILMTGSLQVPP